MTRITVMVLAALCLAAAAPNTHKTPDIQQQQTAVNACALTATQVVELASCNLDFDELGAIVLTVKNRGTIGTAGVQAAASVGQTGRRTATPALPVGIAVYMQDKFVFSLTHPALAAGQSKTIVQALSSAFTVPGCGESRVLKLVVDPKNEFVEGSESDNTLTRNAERPCPDLAIKSISRDYEGVFNETYRVKVTIINQGNAPAPSNQVWASSLPGEPWPVNGWPALTPTQTIPALAPGETTSFKVGGSVLSTNRTAIRIMLDRHSKIAESNESNNMKDERL